MSSASTTSICQFSPNSFLVLLASTMTFVYKILVISFSLASTSNISEIEKPFFIQIFFDFSGTYLFSKYTCIKDFVLFRYSSLHKKIFNEIASLFFTKNQTQNKAN